MSFGEQLARQLDIVAQVTRSPVRQFKSAPDSARGVKARLGYILSPKTGASVDAVARLAGVQPRTVRSWQRGGKPSKASMRKIDAVYQEYLQSNARARNARPRLRKAGRVLAQVRRNRLHFTNDNGNDRYYSPRPAVWADFVDAWAHDQVEFIDDLWDAIVADWQDSDDPEQWNADRITEVAIV